MVLECQTFNTHWTYNSLIFMFNQVFLAKLQIFIPAGHLTLLPRHLRLFKLSKFKTLPLKPLPPHHQMSDPTPQDSGSPIDNSSCHDTYPIHPQISAALSSQHVYCLTIFHFLLLSSYLGRINSLPNIFPYLCPCSTFIFTQRAKRSL